MIYKSKDKTSYVKYLTVGRSVSDEGPLVDAGIVAFSTLDLRQRRTSNNMTRSVCLLSWFLAVITFLSCWSSRAWAAPNTMAHEVTVEDVPVQGARHVVSTDILSPLLGVSLKLHYEYAAFPNISMRFGLVGAYANLMLLVSEYDAPGLGFSLGTRWYPAGIAPKGWWLGMESEARRYGPGNLKNGLFSPKTSLHSLTTVDFGLGIGYQWFVADHFAIGLGLVGSYVVEVANPMTDASGNLAQKTSLPGTSPNSAFKRIHQYVIPKLTLSVGFVF
ncbi:MAG: DUF3575 domain-containing protein [Deltaproteobacteria bacterium]|nr:MAG: DUF3575 domain-containing protein [Deltaproteobacteria bacterium]